MTSSRRQRCIAWGVAFTLLFAATIVPAADVTGLIEELASSDAQKRRNAAYELNQLGAEAVDALPALMKALDDDDEQVFFNAASAIARIGPAAEPGDYCFDQSARPGEPALWRTSQPASCLRPQSDRSCRRRSLAGGGARC